jgi:hypothetical protein
VLHVTWDLTTPAGQISGAADVADAAAAAEQVWAAYRRGGHDAALAQDVALAVAALHREGPPVNARQSLAHVTLTQHA